MPLVPVALALALALQAPAEDPAAAERARWRELVARCGQELAWAANWDEAAARAKAERKAVLAVAWLYPGFDIPDATLSVLAMDPDVIELVNARCVPLRLTHETPVPFAAETSYGLSPAAFGAALLLVAPDGTVLADTPHWQPEAAYDFLSTTLAEHPEFTGAKRPRALSPEERVAWHLARGEQIEANALVGPLSSARGTVLKARLLQRAHRIEPALAAVAHARTLLGAAGGRAQGVREAELERLELALELERGHVGPARVLAERLVGADPASPEALEAAYLLGVLDFFAEDSVGAERRWRALLDEHPESRWALEAAAALLQPETQLADFMLQYRDPELLASFAEVAPAADAGGAGGEDALASALTWLAERRRGDGSWLDPSELEAGPDPHNSISVAIDALAARALLAHRERRPFDLEREAALALAATRASLSERPPSDYMAYDVWSDALALELVVDLLEAGAAATEDLRALGAELAAGLGTRQRSNGGWSYLQATSLEAGAAQPEQSISFVTATVVLALLRARAAGIELDPRSLERGLDTLEAMRDPNGVFAYLLWSHQERTPADEPVAGAAGRAPLCELALLRGGRSDEARLRAALAQFFAHSAALAREAGKALMHCGPEGQGSHYVLYDYATTARALAALPAAEQKPWRVRLLALLDATRRTDGAFTDGPVLGPACGTALALLALAELGEAE